ncbi:uncharacterized protein LOC135841378 [Planococcus citri]|uniref:uncharacterized protein LOC135841378 n=1 Tax=Planococcus citri TaxID=170843 RepID=UPI0031F79EFA
MSAPNEFLPVTSHTFHHDGVSPLVIQAAHSNSNFPATANTNGPHFNGGGFFPNSIGYDVTMLPLFHHTAQRPAHFNAFAHQKQMPNENLSKQDLPHQILAPPDGRSNVFNTETTNNSVQSAYWSRQSQLSPFGVLPHEISPEHIEPETKSYDINTHFAPSPINNINTLGHTDCDKKSQVIVSGKSKDASNMKKYLPKAVNDVKMQHILSSNHYPQNDLVYRNGVINHSSHANLAKVNSSYKSTTKHAETMESLPTVVNETMSPLPRDYRVFKSPPIQFASNPPPAVVNFTGKQNKQYLHKQMPANKSVQNGAMGLKNQQRLNSNGSPSMMLHKMNDYHEDSQSSPISLTSDDLNDHNRYPGDVIRPTNSLKENDQFNMNQMTPNTIAHSVPVSPSIYRDMQTDMNCQDGKKVTQNFNKLPHSPGNVQNNVIVDRNRTSFPPLYIAYNKPAVATSLPMVQKRPHDKVNERNDTQNAPGTPPMMVKSPHQNSPVGYSSVIMRTDRSYEPEDKVDKSPRQMMWPTDRQNHAPVAPPKNDKIVHQSHIQPTVADHQHLLLGLTERQHSYFDTTPCPTQMNTQSMANVKCNSKPLPKMYDDRIPETHQPQVTQPQEPMHHYQQYMQIPNKTTMPQQIEPVVAPPQEQPVVEKPYSRKRKSSKVNEPPRHTLPTEYPARDPPPAHLNMYQQPLQNTGYMMETGARYDVAHNMPKMYSNTEQFYSQPATNNYINPVVTNISHDPAQHQSVISSHANISASRHTPSTSLHQLRNVPAAASIPPSLPLSAYFSSFQSSSSPYHHHDYHPAPAAIPSTPAAAPVEPPVPMTIAGYNINDVQIFPPTAPNKLEKDVYEGRVKVIVPNIEEEFKFLFDPTTPNFKLISAVSEEEAMSKSIAKPMFYRKNIDFLASYIKFLENNCESVETLTDGNSGMLKTWNRNKVAYQPIVRDDNAAESVPPALPKELPKQKEPETNFENDPRYYPLPKSSDKRRLDSSSDESSDEFSKKPKPVPKKVVEEKKKEPVKPKKEVKKVKVKKEPVVETKTSVKTKLEKLEKAKMKLAKLQLKAEKKKHKADMIKPKMEKAIAEIKTIKNSGLQKPKPKDTVKETKVIPRRKVSDRKAKDESMLKQKIQGAIDSENEDQSGDSDSDPSWTPRADDEENGTKRKGIRIRAVRFKTKTVRKSDPTSFKQNFTENHKKQSVEKKETLKNSKATDVGPKSKSFLILKKEANTKHPNLWRKQDEFRLQKFEHYEKDGRHLYRNTSEVCKYSEKDKNKYQEVDISIVEEKNDKIILELCDDTEIPTDLKIKENFMKESLCYEHQFAVYIQTLVSQALDSNFLGEIVKENDDYFLSNMKVIDEVTATYLTDLTGVIKWKENSLSILVKTWPFLSIKSIRGDSSKIKCSSCSKTNSKQTAIFYGQPYQRETLQGCNPNSSIPNDLDKTVDLCRSCSREVKLFNRIWHQKYHTFVECAKYVSKKKSEDKTKGTTDVLNELLADTNWLSKLFYDIRNTWLQIWTIVQKSKDS